MKKRVDSIKHRFLQKYENARTELKYNNLYELLVSVMLSAQCTDKRVNMVTPALFSRFPTISHMADASLDEIKELIKSCSFFNNKAKNLLTMSNQVRDEFGGKIPTTQENLKKLAGVGQKTANVVLIEYLKQNYIAVDTHVFRVSHRLGLSSAKTALQTEEELSKLLKNNLGELHQAFVLFGRYTCKAIKPNCQDCFVQDLCITKSSFKPN